MPTVPKDTTAKSRKSNGSHVSQYTVLQLMTVIFLYYKPLNITVI